MAVETQEVTRWGPWPLRATQAVTLLIAYVILVGVLWLVGSAIVDAGDTVLAEVDRSVATWMVDQRTAGLNTLSDVGSGFSDTITVVIVIALLASTFVAAWRQWGEASTLLTALGLEVTTFVSAAYLVGRERPMVEKLDPAPPTSGFPSGHVAAAVALYWGITYLVFRHTDNVIARAAALVGAIVVPVMVALSRMYRGMHYLTDVTAGAVLGAACLAIAIHVVRSGLRQQGSYDEEVAA